MKIPYLIAGVFILLILIGLLFPCVGGPEDAKRVRARNDLAQLVSATKAYIAEYGEAPTGDRAAIVRALKSENPHRIVFIEIDSKRLSTAGLFLDPWRTPYAFDFTKSAPPVAYSFGKNRTDEGGQGDDIASWK